MTLPNCWEYFGCGREPGGAQAERDGVCAVATCTQADRIHFGRNGGRSCWGIDADKSHCSGRLRPGQSGESQRCSACEFYALVHEQEADCVLAFEEIRQLVYDRPADPSR
ncbi:MAG: two-CW domain-containing protein [Planctomycetota bacterium]